jgi:hypothetical protein
MPEPVLRLRAVLSSAWKNHRVWEGIQGKGSFGKLRAVLSTMPSTSEDLRLYGAIGFKDGRLELCRIILASDR